MRYRLGAGAIALALLLAGLITGCSNAFTGQTCSNFGAGVATVQVSSEETLANIHVTKMRACTFNGNNSVEVWPSDGSKPYNLSYLKLTFSGTVIP